MDKKQKILAAALSLFVEYGFHGTPTAKVAQDAGVANGTLFHHYKTKDDLVTGLYNHTKEELAAYLSSITHDSEFITPKFKNIFFHTLEWALTNRDKFYYIRQFESSPHYATVAPESIQQQNDITWRLISEGIRKKLLQTQPVELLFAIYNSCISGIYQYIVNANLDEDGQKAAIAAGYKMTWDMMKFM